jgi:hypothetical protein
VPQTRNQRQNSRSYARHDTRIKEEEERGMHIKTPRFRLLVLISLLHTLPTIPLAHAGDEADLDPPTTYSLEEALTRAAKDVLEPCSVWPPRLAKNDRERRTKKEDASNLPNATPILIKELTTIINPPKNVDARVYQGSFLRLLDQVGELDPFVPNSRLLGVALEASSDRLDLWGVDLFVMTHDCQSLVALTASGEAGLQIPFFELDAALDALYTLPTTQTTTLIRGSYQSPFHLWYTGNSPDRITFAALKAASWRLRNPNSTNAVYLPVANVLTIQTESNQALKFAGSLRAGAKIPWLGIQGDAKGALAESLRQDWTSFLTYYWTTQPEEKLPDFASISTKITGILGRLKLDTNRLTSSNKISGHAALMGWPQELCNASQWHLKSGQIYRVLDFKMIPENRAKDALPTCSVSCEISIANANDFSSANSSDLADPSLTLVHREKPELSISLRTDRTIGKARDPQFDPDFVRAYWRNESDGPGGDCTELVWNVTGQIRIPDDRRVDVVQLDESDVWCEYGDQGESVEHLSFSKTRKPDGTSPFLATDVDGTIEVSLVVSQEGTRTFDCDRRTGCAVRECRIRGTLRVDTTDLEGEAHETAEVEFRTIGNIYYPAEIPPRPPAAPEKVVVKREADYITVNWSKSAGAEAYNVYRGESPDELRLIADERRSLSHLDTTAVNDVEYYYQVSALSCAAEGERSEGVRVAPSQSE